MKLRPTLLVLSALCLAGHAHAQKMAPGLWEHTVTMKGAGSGADGAMAQMQQQLESMPPEKRKRMEAMMANRGGSMPGGVGMMGGAPAVIKICITPEQAARDDMPQGDGNCQQTSRERNGKTLKFKFTCTGAQPMSGEGEYTSSGDKAYTGHVVIDSATPGQPGRMEMDNSGRWVSADCGDVKPHVAPAKK